MLTPRQAQFAFVPLMVTVMSALIGFVMTLARLTRAQPSGRELGQMG